MERTDIIQTAPRKSLMEWLDKIAKKGFIYIHAPAGYGKSFSMRLWLTHRNVSKERPLPSAWIALTESAGGKPFEFCERLAVALLALQPNNSKLKELMTHKSFATAPFEFTEQILNSFRSFESDLPTYTLVMDDLHLITHPEILKRLPDFILQLLDFMTLCIVSRTEPPDSFSSFIVKDMLAIVDMQHLKFSESEIKSFFLACGQKLSRQQVQHILSATDGWAIGLNALLLSGSQLTEHKLYSRYLETFIKNQVWEKWDKERQDFLLRVSIVEELTPEFCNAMTHRKDSAKILNAMVRENAFISVDNENIYRFHHLFIDFLKNMADRESEKRKIEFYKRAADWFYEHGDNYKAVEYYIKCKDKSGITKGLKLMYDYNSPYAAIENTLNIIRLSVDGEIVNKYPFLLEVQAWAAFVEGHGSDMENYLDQYFKSLPTIIIQNPSSAQTAILLRCMDYRNSMIDVTKRLKKLPLKFFAQANTPSITNNMPLFHRSGRDFSEYIIDEKNNFELLRKTIGVLVGEEYEVMETIIKAGLAYERGDLDRAYDFALSASTKIKDSFAPEIQFCFFMIHAAILDAQGQQSDALKILEAAMNMIERQKAYYLNANYRAFSYRMKFADGNLEAAGEWLTLYSESPYNSLTFFKLYQHFTTARAYIVTGDYTAAIMILTKLQHLSEQYRRPLDIIESKILLAIAYWKKVRGQQTKALEILEQAIVLSLEFGYTQIFAHEGAELSNMLNKLQKRVVQMEYDGKAPVKTIKNLYVMVLAQTKHSKGLTGGRVSKALTFTEQQKIVMRYLNDGLTHKEIAEKMGLKHSAIKSHMNLIFRKLDVSNGVDAILKMRELGMNTGG